MEKNKNGSVWIIRTNVSDGLRKIILPNRAENTLVFKCPMKREVIKETPSTLAGKILSPIRTSPSKMKLMKGNLKNLFTKAVPGDWVLISHDPASIDAAGIIQKKTSRAQIYQVKESVVEFTVQWFFIEKMKLPQAEELHYENLVLRYASPAKGVGIFKHVLQLLPAFAMKPPKVRIPRVRRRKISMGDTVLIGRSGKSFKRKTGLKREGIISRKLALKRTPAKKLGGTPQKERRLMAMAPPLEEPGGVVELFYATNRGRSGMEAPNDFYTDEYIETRYGICRVNIPRKHEKGEVERPTWWKLQFSESPERDVMLLDLHEVSAEDFTSTLAMRMNEKSQKEALLFVHGYNNDFKKAAWRTGQIVFDLAFQGVSAFYSWPSAGNTPGYIHDLQMAQLCKPKLKDFVKILLKIPEVTKLHIIAHSMGTYILTSALDLLADDKEIEQKLDILHQVILCAPDIDQKEFKEQIYPRFKTLGDQRTIYASSKDKALKASDIIREGMPRLGQGGKHLFVIEGIDTVDATNVRTDLLGHGYFAQTKELINDLYHIIKNELTPDKRNLRKRNTKEQLIYWLFPE